MGGNYKMIRQYTVIIITILFLVHKMFFYIWSVSYQDLVGNYCSVYNNIEYKLKLAANGHCEMTSISLLNDKILETKHCKNWGLKEGAYNIWPLNIISCNYCSSTDIDFDINRGFFDIKIENPSNSSKRIDGVEGVYFSKINP